MGGHREKVPPADQEGAHRWNKDTLAPSSWASQPPELGERNVCCLEATRSLYFVIGPKWAETGNAVFSFLPSGEPAGARWGQRAKWRQVENLGARLGVPSPQSFQYMSLMGTEQERQVLTEATDCGSLYDQR